MGIEDNRILLVLCAERRTKYRQTIELSLNNAVLQCDEDQSADILIKLLNGQLNKCFADYLESGSVLSNKPILSDALHGMDKIIAWAGVIRIESLN